MKTIDGKDILQVRDDAEEFVAMTENPFLHGCCDCGLSHRVEFALVDRDGNEVAMPDGAFLALRFRRDEEQTVNFRSRMEE